MQIEQEEEEEERTKEGKRVIVNAIACVAFLVPAWGVMVHKHQVLDNTLTHT